MLLGAFSLLMAMRKSPVKVVAGEHLPFSHVVGRVAAHAWAGSGRYRFYRAGNFCGLFYLSRNWNGAVFCITAFGVAFILARLLFIQAIIALEVIRWR